MKIQKCDFEITVDPVGRIFGWGLRSYAFVGPHGGHAHFHANKAPKIQNRQIITITLISHQQSIDNDLLTSHKKSAQLANKWLSYGQKTLARHKSVAQPRKTFRKTQKQLKVEIKFPTAV